MLRGGGVTDLLIDRGLDAESLLLDMPRLWEAAACRLIRDPAPAGAEFVASTRKTALTVFGDCGSRMHRAEAFAGDRHVVVTEVAVELGGDLA
ncbi:hypothetical protein ACWCW7_34775 [Nocardia tengchongensis]